MAGDHHTLSGDRRLSQAAITDFVAGRLDGDDSLLVSAACVDPAFADALADARQAQARVHARFRAEARLRDRAA